MSKIIDITDKLNFEEKPIVKVKDVEITANNDAVSMLKVVAIFEDGEKSTNVQDILKLYELLFAPSEQAKIEALNLDMDDFTTLVTQTAKLIVGGENEGETVTPATT